MPFDLNKLDRHLSFKTTEEKKKILEGPGNVLLTNPNFIWLQKTQKEIQDIQTIKEAGVEIKQ